MFKIVKKAVDEFNPFCLLPDAPDDEFDSESRDIAGRINVNSTVEEIASIISSVFSRSFDEIFEIAYCMKTAEKIHHAINHKE